MRTMVSTSRHNNLVNIPLWVLSRLCNAFICWIKAVEFVPEKDKDDIVEMDDQK